jgi:hypothetical protein
VVIFSVVILGLVGLAYQVARRSTRATDQALVMSALVSAIDEVTTADFDSLAGMVGCDTTLSRNIVVETCLTVTSVSPRLSDVTLVVSTNLPAGRPDTVTLRRSAGRSAIPLR